MFGRKKKRPVQTLAQAVTKSIPEGSDHFKALETSAHAVDVMHRLITGEVNSQPGEKMAMTPELSDILRISLLKLGFPAAVAADIGQCITKHTRRKWSFTMISQNDYRDALRVISHLPRRATCYHVFGLLFATMEQDTGRSRLTASQLAREAGVNQANCSKAMTELVKVGLIRGVGRHGQTKDWYVNPAVCWRGSEQERQDAMKAWIAQTELFGDAIIKTANDVESGKVTPLHAA
jgi:hypothetical protein